MRSIEDLRTELGTDQVTSQELVEECLAAIDDPAGEGSRTYLRVYRDEALVLARATDEARRGGARLPPFAGIPVSIKDIFDVQGEPTPAGSKVLADAPVAVGDAPVIARLRAAGFILIGRTNMTEFAYSGVGLNPHFGTPRNPYDRDTGRIPGGSSSGAAVSVTDGMAAAAVGTDTGGSCRIPAALSGLVGFKPTARRVPLEGTIPLSPTLDSIGPLAATVCSCEILDTVLSDSGIPTAGSNTGMVTWTETFDAAAHTRRLRFVVPQSLVLEDMDRDVAANFDRALKQLSQEGAEIEELAMRELAELPEINSGGGLAAAESWAWHRILLEDQGTQYDPRVASRIRRGNAQSAADYIDLLTARSSIRRSVDEMMASVDALVFPTVPLIAPPIAQLDSDDDYFRLNNLMLRNPSVVNFLDMCAISIPCHRAGEAPVGLMFVGKRNRDRQLFELARRAEAILSC